MSRWMRVLREAEWFDARRARAYAVILAAGLAGLTLWTMLAPGAAPPGGDFLSFYAASALAQAGHAADVWVIDLHQAAEQAVLPALRGYYAFFYPPLYLLICFPLAWLPFGAARFAWLAGTVLLAWIGMAAYLRNLRVPLAETALLLTLPALWINAMNGQNGALTLALVAGGFALMDRRPVVSGLLLACLLIKPQLALALPFVLLASGRWRVLAAAIGGAILLCLAALPLAGVDGYRNFFANLANARAALGGGVDPALMQSFYAALERYGAPGPVAAAGQLVLGAGVLVLAVRSARRMRHDAAALGALGVSASLLVSPFMLDYDLTMTALPAAWLIVRGCEAGFRPWEKLALAIILVLPVVERLLALSAGLQLGPLMLAGLFAMVLGRTLPQVTPAEIAPVADSPS